MDRIVRTEVWDEVAGNSGKLLAVIDDVIGLRDKHRIDVRDELVLTVPRDSAVVNPDVTGPLTSLEAFDDFIEAVDFTDLDTHTADILIGSWEYGAIGSDWQVETNSASSQNASTLFCRNTVDIPQIETEGFEIKSRIGRGPVDNVNWVSGLMFWCDSVQVAQKTTVSGIFIGGRRAGPSFSQFKVERYNDAGALQDNFTIVSLFPHVVNTDEVYGGLVHADGVTITPFDEDGVTAVRTYYPPVTLTADIRDSNHLRVGMHAGAGGTSGRGFMRDIALRFEATVPAVLQIGRVLRVTDITQPPETETFEEWRILKTTERRADGGNTMSIIGAPICQDLLRGVVQRTEVEGSVFPDFELIGLTPTQLIQNVILPLAPSYFAVGTIDPTDPIEFSFEYDSPLSAIKEIAAITETRLQCRRGAGDQYFIDLVDDSNLLVLADVDATAVALDNFNDTDELAITSHTADLVLGTWTQVGASLTIQTDLPSTGENSVSHTAALAADGPGTIFSQNVVAGISAGEQFTIYGESFRDTVTAESTSDQWGVGYRMGDGTASNQGGFIWGWRGAASAGANLVDLIFTELSDTHVATVTVVQTDFSFPQNTRLRFGATVSGGTSTATGIHWVESTTAAPGSSRTIIEIRDLTTGAFSDGRVGTQRMGVRAQKQAETGVQHGLERLVIVLGDGVARPPETPHIRLGKNLKTLERALDARDQATVIVGRTGGDVVERITIAEARWEVTDLSGGVRLKDPSDNSSSPVGPIGFDDQLGGSGTTLPNRFLRKKDGTLTLITESTFSTQSLVVADQSGIAVGDILKIRADGAGKQLIELASPLDFANFGRIPRVLAVDNIAPVQNLVENPELTGTYVSGIPPQWVRVGSAGTVAENTNTDFTRRGGQSVHFTFTGSGNDGEGIETDPITVEPTQEKPFFSAFATVKLVSGRIRVELEASGGSGNQIYPSGDDGRATTSELDAWVDLGVRGLDINKEGATTLTLRIVVDGDLATEFYVDSGQTTQSAVHLPFTAQDAAVALWLAVNRELDLKGQPALKVAVTPVDLTRIDPKTWPYDQFVVAGVVRIFDPDLNAIIVGRTNELDRNRLVFGDTKIKLSNRLDELVDRLQRPRRRSRFGTDTFGRFDNPAIADPTIGPPIVNDTTVSFAVIFDPETARIECYSNHAAATPVPAPTQDGRFSCGAIIPPSAAVLISGRENEFLTALFVAYDKLGTRGKSTLFTDIELVQSVAQGPTGAPTSLTSPAQTTTTIDLSWTIGDSNSTTRVYRNGIALVPSRNPGVSTFTDTGLPPDTTFTYEVDHFRNGQASAKSNALNVSTDPLPQLSPPSGFSAVGDASLGMTFAWTGGDATATTVIERDVDTMFLNPVRVKLAPAGAEEEDDNSEPFGTFSFRCFHRKSGFTDSAVSNSGTSAYFNMA